MGFCSAHFGRRRQVSLKTRFAIARTCVFAFLPLPLIVVLLSFPSYAQKQKPGKVKPQEPEHDEVVRINTTLVTVPVRVKDRKGKFVLNLRREDFHLYEDGAEQEVVYFESPEGPEKARPESDKKPLTVALLLDVSDSTEFKLVQIQNAATAFLDQLRADDHVLVIAFDKR